MKKLNNKGMTTIEIILCFVLISIITISMYSTITSFNEKREEESYKEQINTYKNTLTKQIQDDFIKIGLTSVKYNKTVDGSKTNIYTLDCKLKDGSKRKLIIKQRLGYSPYHLGGVDNDDYFMISYGKYISDSNNELINYPIPDLGEYKENNTTGSGEHTIKDLSINKVLIKIKDERVLSIYIGFYHPALGTKYHIQIVSPINYIPSEAKKMSEGVPLPNPGGSGGDPSGDPSDPGGDPSTPEVGNLLYDVLKDEAESDGIAVEYTKGHQDTMAGVGSEKIYYWQFKDFSNFTNYNDYLNYTTAARETLSSKSNVIFGNHCWKMIRTTDTGGVKLIYNGTSKDGKCLKSNKTSFYYGVTGNTDIRKTLKNGMYLGSSYEYDPETKTSTLTGNITQYDPNTSGSIKGMYTCMNKTSTTCSGTIYLIYENNRTEADTITIAHHTGDVDFNTIGFLPYNYVYNYTYYYNVNLGRGDGSLAYAGYMHGTVYPTKTDDEVADNDHLSSYFGNGVRYPDIYNGYELTYASEMDFNACPNSDWGGSSGGGGCKDYHYTCYESSMSPDHCNPVNYIHNRYDRTSYYYGIQLKDGDTVDNAINEMLNKNTNDSLIKFGIDAWYKNNLTDYSNYLEDTIYCNDRRTNSIGGWDPHTSIDKDLTFLFKGISNTSGITDAINSTSLKCSRDIDSLSVSNSNAKLNYPIGLLTLPEMILLYYTNVLGSNDFWLGTPSYYNGEDAQIHIYSDYGIDKEKIAYLGSSARPVISLKPGIKYFDGEGTEDNPFKDLRFE